MWIVAVAWMYVAVMMAVAQATSPDGSLGGAFGILVFYGVLPVSLVMYVLFTPHRKRARKAREQLELSNASAQADASSLPASDTVAPERKEPPGV
jgi:membrane protein CcdC involved in cytochrome C biogenesis